jgi:hypothetical protein
LVEVGGELGFAVGVGLGFAVGVGLGFAVGVGFGFGVGLGFAVGVGLGFAVGVGLGVWPIIAVGLDPCVAAAPGLSVFAVGVPAAAEAIGRTLDVEEPQAARTIAAARASGSTMGQPSPRVLGVR